MVGKEDSFDQIANDLEQQLDNQSNPFSHKVSTGVLIIITFIMMLGIGLAILFYLSKINSHLSSNYTEPTLRDMYISRVEDYEFRWELDDFDTLTANQNTSGDRLDDIIARFGKPSEVDDSSPPQLFFIYTDQDTGRMVTLNFKRYGGEEFYLENKTFSHFPVPKEFQLQFADGGQPLTREMVREWQHIVDFRTDDGQVLRDLLTMYQKPESSAYTKDIYHDSLQLYYVLEGTTDIVHLNFIKDGEHFLLERLWANFYEVP